MTIITGLSKAIASLSLLSIDCLQAWILGLQHVLTRVIALIPALAPRKAQQPYNDSLSSETKLPGPTPPLQLV